MSTDYNQIHEYQHWYAQIFKISVLLLSIVALFACGKSNNHAEESGTKNGNVTQTEPQNTTFPVDRYLSYEQISTVMSELAANSTAELVDIGSSVERRPLKALHIPSKSGQPAPAVLMISGLHGREWIAPPQLINLAQRLLQPNATNGVDRTNLEIWIVPVANPDGYIYSWKSDRF